MAISYSFCSSCLCPIFTRISALGLIGPVRPDSSWQAQAKQGYDVSHFSIDWKTHQVVCPQGKMNTCWTPHMDAYGTPVVSVKFSRTDCCLCPAHSLCTRSVEAPRHVTLRMQADHETLQRIRVQQTTMEWRGPFHRELALLGSVDLVILGKRKPICNMS